MPSVVAIRSWTRWVGASMEIRCRMSGIVVSFLCSGGDEDVGRSGIGGRPGRARGDRDRGQCGKYGEDHARPQGRAESGRHRGRTAEVAVRGEYGAGNCDREDGAETLPIVVDA